jgi:hypothetical protein
MENKKQNSIEWLIEELTKNGFNFKLYRKEIQQAKEMYNKEIAEVYKAGYDDFMYNLFDESEKEYSERISLKETFKDLK